MAIALRPYQPTDLEAAIAIYRDAALVTGAQAYNADQVAVWADFASDRAAFQTRLSQGTTLVALIDAEPAAFAQLHPQHHLALLYTSSRYGRCGCATQLYRALEAIAREQSVTQLDTEASHIARPFFLKMGFQVRVQERVERQGQTFERFQMVKAIAS